MFERLLQVYAWLQQEFPEYAWVYNHRAEKPLDPASVTDLVSFVTVPDGVRNPWLDMLRAMGWWTPAEVAEGKAAAAAGAGPAWKGRKADGSYWEAGLKQPHWWWIHTLILVRTYYMAGWVDTDGDKVPGGNQIRINQSFYHLPILEEAAAVATSLGFLVGLFKCDSQR